MENSGTRLAGKVAIVTGAEAAPQWMALDERHQFSLLGRVPRFCW